MVSGAVRNRRAGRAAHRTGARKAFAGAPAAALILVAATLLATGATAAPRVEALEPDHVSGRFTSNEGTLGITWGKDSPTEPAWSAAPCTPAGAATTCTRPGYALFTSDPFPRRIHLNVNRLVWVDLVTSRDIKDTVSINITVDGQILGIQPASSAGTGTTKGYPPHPTGKFATWFRLHPEIATIEAGSILAVNVSYVTNQDAQNPWTLYLKDPQPAFLNLTYWSGDELDRRFPEESAQSEDLLGLLVPGLFALGGRRLGARRVALVLLLTGLAGCTGPKADEPTRSEDGSAERDVVPDTQGLLPEGFGAIHGRVFDDRNVSLAGVYVSILQTSHFMKTDKFGRFSFTNVTPGAYVLRYEHAAFRTLQAPEVIEADSITRVRVSLVPLNGDLSRAHTHTYWLAGETERVVVNETRSVGSLTMTDPNGHPILIYPGTSAIRFELSDVVFTASPPASKVYKVQFQNRYDRQYTDLGLRGYGVPSVIQVSWEMQDEGHQKTSDWLLLLFATGVKNMHVRVTLVRGTLPLERPHPDHWREGNTFTSVEYAKVASCTNAAGTGCTFSRPTQVIPPGTTWVQILLEQSWDTSTEYGVRFRTNVGEPLLDAALVNRGPFRSEFRHAVNETMADGYYQRTSVWQFGVKPEPGADVATNALHSAQDIVGSGFASISGLNSLTGYGNGEVEFRYTVIAHRDALEAFA